MDAEKLFNDLESNNLEEFEDTKKKLTELFSQTKEQWLVQGMLDYYLTTNSVRIIEILVKVQSPHDIYVFDRLSDWLRGQNRVPSLTVFSFIVRKQPSWLYKIAKHKLMKDILKLLQTEKEIIPLMCALLSIIILLPIIPSLVPNFLSELFDVFGHLASWNCQNPNKLSKNQLIHLQIGLYMLFHRLYGMYPCHFISYLREFKDKEKGAIFHHTIKPLLETVRMHPMLITATKDNEISITRWKEMEPHDVVVECAKLSLDYYQDNSECFANVALRTQESFPVNNEIPASKQLQSLLRGDTYFQSSAPAFYSTLQSELIDAHHNSDNIWSPRIDILATPPPTGTVPHTPTPSYGVPLASSSATVANVSTNSNNLLGGTGASPPEAAVEATPETTPMKDINLKRIIASNSPAIRAILPSSQPSSPMRKEQSPFNFPESSSGQLFSTTYNIEQTTTTRITALHRQLENQIMLGNCSGSASGTKQLVGQLSLPSESLNQISELNAMQQRQPYFMKFSSNFGASLDSPTNFNESAHDDQETTTGLTTTTSQHQIYGPHHSDTLQDISNEYGDDGENDDDNDETERSPCSIGGLHAPSNRSLQILAQRIKRNRLASYCYNDTSSYLSYGTSPADVTNADINCEMSILKNAKLRRVKSWHAIESIRSLNDEDNCCCCFEALDNNLLNNNHSNHHQGQVQEISQQQNGGDSSSPSGDDAISAATHFKKLQQKKEKKLLFNQQQEQQHQQRQSNQEVNSFRIHHNHNRSHHSHHSHHPYSYSYHHHHHNHHHSNHNHNRNRNHNQFQQNSIETQTIEQWPQAYEHNLLELLSEDHRLRSSTEICTKFHQPTEILLEQYIEKTIKMKQSMDAKNREEALKDQIQLLQLQLQFERYRREIHAERNRRLLGKSREMRSLQIDNDRLKDQLNKLQDEIQKLMTQIDKSRHLNDDKECEMERQLNTWKSKYHAELEDNKKLRSTIETLQRRLNEEIKQRRETNYEIEALRGEIFDLRNDMQQAQYQAELGTRYKFELTKLESEFLVMGETQIKCRDKLIELDNKKAKEDEITHVQEAYNDEIKELRSILEVKSSQLEAVKHKLNEVQSQLANKEVMFTDQKRFLKSVKDEYEEKFRALNNKYEVQKAIILSMEQAIFEFYKSQSNVNLTTFSPESDKTDIAGSVDHTSPLSLSLASSEGLSASLRSVPELRNLQALVVQPNTASLNTTIQPTIVSSSSSSLGTAAIATAATLTSLSQLQLQQQQHQQQFLRRGSTNTQQPTTINTNINRSSNSFFHSSINNTATKQSTATLQPPGRTVRTFSIPNTSQIITTTAIASTISSSSSSLSAAAAATAVTVSASAASATSLMGSSNIQVSLQQSTTVSGGGTTSRHLSASSVDIPVPGPNQQHHSNLRHHR